MKAAGEHDPTSRGRMISLAIIAVAIAAGVYAARRSASLVAMFCLLTALGIVVLRDHLH